MSATMTETQPKIFYQAAQPVPLNYPDHDQTSFVGRMTLDEYLEFDSLSTIKHELIQGRVIQMPGAKVNHNRITLDTSIAFTLALQNSGQLGEVFADGQKVQVDEDSVFYPDMMLVAGETRITPGEALLNPAVILEVLSESTAGFDRGEKFELYQRLESLRHYILIEQDRISVTHFEKNSAGQWVIASIGNSLDNSLTVTIENATLSIPLTAIYRRVEIPIRETAV